MKSVHCVIIGAGPAGLAAACQLSGNTVVLEQQSTVGGLCRSVHRAGGVFDIGGHSFHTPHPEVHELVNAVTGGLYHQQREARVYTCNRLIPYPFQKHFDQLPSPELVGACEQGLRENREPPEEAANFEEYIIRKFGRGIADCFMLPYNRKLWARDLRRISCEWTSQRVAGPKGTNEHFQTTGGTRKPLQSDTAVGYPLKGGFEEIYKAFEPLLANLQLNQRVAEINPRARTVRTEGGQVYCWEFLVSTMPLPELLNKTIGTPLDLINAAARLEYMSLRVELLLVGRSLNTHVQRIYVADPEIPPHKIALNHNSSDYLRRKPCHAVTAEVSLSEEKTTDVEEIGPATITFLTRLGIIDSPGEVIWKDHVDVRYAYPVYTPARRSIVSKIKTWLQSFHIYPVGRFGDWDYINSDEAVMKGLELGRELRTRYSVGTSEPAGSALS